MVLISHNSAPKFLVGQVNKIFLFSIIVICILSNNSIAAPPQPPNNVSVSEYSNLTANKKALPKAQRLLAFFYALREQPNNRVLSGQYTGAMGAIPSCYTNHIEALHTQTGKWIAIVAGDWGHGTAIYTPAGKKATQKLIDYWNVGHLIALSWHCPNPWTGGNAWDGGSVNLTDLITPGTRVNTTWMSFLDKMADGLRELQEAGVIVLWRPFHEVNGRWFWWGKGTQSQYKALWRHMFDYFTEDRGLNNLLWVFSPSGIKPSEKFPPAVSFYPGNDVVDITGLDNYCPYLDQKGFPYHYDDMVALGKPFGLGEYGPGLSVPPYTFDYTILINQIRDNFPKTCFWVSWDQTSAIIHNRNAEELLNDPWVITRDELSF